MRGLLNPACGPVVRVELHPPSGPALKGHAVIDTGASMSAVDRDVALRLGLPSHGAAEWVAVSDGSPHPLAPLRRAALRIEPDTRLWELDLIEVPNLVHAVGGFQVLVLLGWDFLDQCVLVCDGPSGTFSLTLPPVFGR